MTPPGLPAPVDFDLLSNPAPDDRPRDDRGSADTDTLVVDLDGWEGPLDVLLALARSQKVDLRRLSIVRLADQYLAYVAAARRASLELAAEYLVMAAWLADLKSRLLLPEPPGPEEPDAEAAAAALTFQIRRLDAMREAGVNLTARPQLGRDTWLRGAPEPIVETRVEVVDADLHQLLRAWGRHLARRRREQPLDLTEPVVLDCVEAALERMRRSLGHAPDWESLTRYLPAGTLERLRAGSLEARSSLAATFAATLELVRRGEVILRQNRPFGPIFLRCGEGRGREAGVGPARGPETEPGPEVVQ